MAAQPPATPAATAISPAFEQALDDADGGDVFALERHGTTSADARLSAIANARIAAARLRAKDAIALARPVADDEDAPPAHRARAFAVLADAAFTAGDYADAATAADGWLDALNRTRAPQSERDDAQRLGALARALSTAPKQRMHSLVPAPAATRRDKVGLSRADATVNGHVQEAVLDTGAGLSVVSQRTATRLGLRMLDAAATIDSASRDAVPTRIGIAERFAFAGLELRDVAFLVLDDRQLELPVPGGYTIDAIIGFPVLREFRRLRFERSGALVPQAPVHAEATTENLRIVASALYVDAKLRDVPVALHLDTGGPRSSLSSRFAARHPHFADGLPQQDERMAGAGGATTRRVARIADAALDLAGRRAMLPELTIVTKDGEDVQAQNFGLLGGDVLDQFDSWTLDFDAMTFELGAPR
ncbi:pepsin/retropepsin-like aspartic protease family protein [Lysobacter auxotrophicus]|uniref:Retroviral-like aspartic protease family protein n=1 Tax=Lysobacter auxotrophicus TaxID=2992573 RepID=A0ABM8DCV9_9GAMM|nr:pepsin/retropepsin-like aspartic protease family protein [Lysobacter auxotrophicus]BDU16429.1 retroviral-like aspartic protease family protein [Lysobacter auxotrophicus]